MLFHTPPASDPASPVTADGGVENRIPKGGPEKAGEPASVNTPLSSIVHRWVSERVSDVGADGAQKSPGEVVNGRRVGVRLEEEIVVENVWLISVFAGGHKSEQRGAIRGNTGGFV